MNILDLPQELVVHILLQLDPSDIVVCGQISRYFKSLLDTAVIRYKFALAGAGMVDGPASGVPVKDRLLALERYTQAWRTAELAQDPEFPIDRNEHYRCLTFTGGAIPVVQGSQLRLVVPASPARGIPSQVWSMDLGLGDTSSRPLRCTTDLSQSLFVMCCLKPHPTRALACQIYSLSDTTLSLHSEAAVPAISADAGSAHEPFVVQMDVCHDLFVWSWYADSKVHLRVYNWKSGIVVWERADSDGPQKHFAFLDKHHLVVASNNGSQLNVYTVDPNRPASTVAASPDYASGSMRVFSLPPTEEGSSVQIKQLSSQRTSPGRPDCVAAFEHDPQLTILAISLHVVSEPSGDSQAHTLIVPTSALLEHASSAADHRQQPPRPDGTRSDVPWEAWGAPCSRLFPLASGLQWWDVRAVGSRCLFFSFRTGRPIALDILVAHFSPWARYGAADGGVDPLAEYADTSDVITVHENLVGPIHNRLPFHAVRMTVVYGEAVDFNWFSSFVALLPDGVAVTNNSDTESTQSLLHLFSA